MTNLFSLSLIIPHSFSIYKKTGMKKFLSPHLLTGKTDDTRKEGT